MSNFLLNVLDGVSGKSFVKSYANLASFPTVGFSGYLYLDLATSSLYYWDGSTYQRASTGGNPIIDGEVDYYANLPDPVIHDRETYYVKNWSISNPTKLSGLYISDGVSWARRSDKVLYSLTAFTATNKIIVTADTDRQTKETSVGIDSSGNVTSVNSLKANTSGGLSLYASNGTLIGDIGVGNTANNTWEGVQKLNNLTASSAVATDALKNLVSVTNTGLGNNVLATSPTFSTSVDSSATFGAWASSTNLTMGYTGTGASSTTNISSAALTGSFTKTLNLGTGGTTSSTTAVNIGSSVNSTTTINGTTNLAAQTASKPLWTDASKNITTGSAGGLSAVTNVTSSTQAMTTNTGYTVSCNTATCVLTLPTTAAVGDIIEIVGNSQLFGWQIAQNAGQYIIMPDGQMTAVGTAGSITQTAKYSSIRLRCVVANLGFEVQNITGPAVTFVTWDGPTSVSNLSFWGDATQDSTGAVSSWTDRSGSGNSPTQGTGANQPVNTASTINSQNALIFDGTNDNLQFASTTLVQAPITIFAVGKNTNTSATYVGKSSGATNGNIRLATGSSGVVRLTINDSTGVSINLDWTTNTISTNMIAVGQVSGVDGESIKLAVNSTTLSSSSSTQSGFSNNTLTSRIGSNSSGTSTFLAGNIGELLIYKRALTQAEISQIMTFLSYKWGITLS